SSGAPRGGRSLRATRWCGARARASSVPGPAGSPTRPGSSSTPSPRLDPRRRPARRCGPEHDPVPGEVEEVPTMSETKTDAGGCHCGKVRFEATTDLAKVTACNCSICSRAGWLLVFVPDEQFKLLSDEESLADYQFGKKRVHHTFCRECGIHAFGHGAGPG